MVKLDSKVYFNKIKMQVNNLRVFRKINPGHFILAILAMLFSARIVMACTPSLPTIIIEARINKNLLDQQKSCLDQNCIYVLEKDQPNYFSLKRNNNAITRSSEQDIGTVDNEGKTIRFKDFLFFGDKTLLNEIAFFEALEKLIENDISDIKPLLFEEIEKWIENKKGSFLSGNLIISPYDPQKESELLKRKNQLLNCHYPEYKIVGNWFIENETSRDYCYLFGRIGGMCPLTVISYPKFLLFLLTNINSITISYFFALFLLIILVVMFATYLVRKYFFRRRKTNVILTIIAATILSSCFLIGIVVVERIFRYLSLFYDYFI